MVTKKKVTRKPTKSTKPRSAAPKVTKRTVISTELAPKAIGPYSQAIRVGDFIFTAGQVPIDPATGQLIDGDISAQTRRALMNVNAILDAAGTSMSKVVKTTVFMANMNDFSLMNAVYAEFFPVDPPARSTFAVAALPRNALIEIETITLA
jgi:2-iminobutanoate/2-iminopropanoate deaminase